MEKSVNVTQREGELPLREKQKATETGTHEGRWFEPAVDIYETEEALTVVADIPGVEPSDIETDLRENLLTLTARVRTPERPLRSLHEEYGVGHFTRQFRLGQQIDQTRISATARDGVLTLTLPKAENARPRKIQVKVG